MSPSMSHGLSPAVVDHLQILMKRERTAYNRANDVRCGARIDESLSKSDLASVRSSNSSSRSSASSSSSPSSLGVNQHGWRERICDWSYSVVDHFAFDRETVSVSLAYLDRFLSKRQVNQKVFQLAAMTTLYLAIKLYEPRTLKVTSLIALSRGYFNVDHVVGMEIAILRDLSWFVHPPTPQCFSRHFIELLPDGTKEARKRKREVMELSNYLIELSVCDRYFVTLNASSVALAALVNTMDILFPEEPASEWAPFTSMKHGFVERVQELLPTINFDSNQEIRKCLGRLEDIYNKALSSQKEEESQAHLPRDVRSDSVSPSCVSGIIQEIQGYS